MLEHVDAALEALFRAQVPLSAQGVDVTFETPTKEWSARLNRPTVNLFLWDLKRSSEHARAGVERVERDGVAMSRMALPVVELRYLVTAWTSDHRDERALLGGLLRAVLATRQIPPTFVPAELHETLTMRLARTGETPLDVFKLVDNTMKAALDVAVVTPFDIGVEQPLAAPVTEIGVHIGDLTVPARAVEIRRIAGEVRFPAAGTVVRSPRSATVVNDTNRFLIAAAPGDEITLDTEPPRSAVVPDHGGVVIE
jgi:hypothetical protein